jgi:sugar phosphate isomerase/epimerase
MAIRYTAADGCLYYFHAKDNRIEQKNVDYYGLTDMQAYSNVQDRAWQFRTIGFGHGMDEWANIISTLRLMGYDSYVSIEHEDALMSSNEGLDKAIMNLKPFIMEESASTPKMFDK